MIREAFDYGPWAYSVDRLKKLLIERPRASILLPVTGLAIAIRRGWVVVDREAAMGADLEKPLLIVPYPSTRGQYTIAAYHPPSRREWLVVDGWHRVTRAVAQRQSMLPAFPFTEEEANAARFLIPGRHFASAAAAMGRTAGPVPIPTEK